MVYRIAISQVGKKELADDIFQDVFLQLVRHQNRLENENHAKYWLIRTTINRCKNYFGSYWHRHVIPFSKEDDSSEDTIPHDIIFMIFSLPPHLRSVIYLHYYEGYNMNEIAAILKIKPGTVKSRLYQARNILKQQMNEE